MSASFTVLHSFIVNGSLYDYFMRYRLILASACAVATLDVGAQSASLPDRDTFLAKVRERLASNSLLQSGFRFRERVTQLRLNPFGRMGTGPVEVFEVYPLDEGLTYRRLVERDGKPLPSAELTAQDRDFLVRYETWRRELAREGQSERDARLRREAAAREKDRAQAREALSLFTFSLDRRDTIAGQSAIVVAFTPRQGVNPRTREGRVASSFAGRAWVHERDYEVMKVEAEAIQDTSFGFGVVARLHKGATALFLRRPIHDTWLPVETRFTGTGRAMLFRKVTINFVREYFDYRRFDPTELRPLLAASTNNN